MELRMRIRSVVISSYVIVANPAGPKLCEPPNVQNRSTIDRDVEDKRVRNEQEPIYPRLIK